MYRTKPKNLKNRTFKPRRQPRQNIIRRKIQSSQDDIYTPLETYSPVPQSTQLTQGNKTIYTYPQQVPLNTALTLASPRQP